MPNVQVNLKHPKSVNGLGIAALVLGILAVVVCWIPFLWLVCILLAMIGLILGGIGFFTALVGRKSGVGMPISGSLVCAVAIIISVLVTGASVSAIDETMRDLDTPSAFSSSMLPTPTGNGDSPGSRPASPTDSREFKIVDIDIKVTESNDVWWKFAWRLTLKNRTNHSILLNATIELQDAEGFIVDDDVAYGLHLGPYEEKTFTGYALVRAGVAPQVSRTVAKVSRRLW